MNNFWSIWIIVIVLLNIGGCAWLLMWTRNMDSAGMPDDGTTGHEYDGIREYNNPLPRWWLMLFWITIVFGLGYLTLYPGLGKYPGVLGWKSRDAHVATVDGKDQWVLTVDPKHPSELATAEQAYQAQYGKIYADYAKVPLTELAKDPRAMKIAGRLFANNCSMCHGTDAHGAVGFPNLTDNDWLYGGAPETIEETILNGRLSVGMPSQSQQATPLSDEQVKQAANYVLTLSGRKADDPSLVAAGQTIFSTVCLACHGPDGKGMQAMGAPNLTDNIWLYGGSLKAIEQTISNGRKGQMPAQKDALGPEKVHLLAAYVWSLSQKPAQ